MFKDQETNVTVNRVERINAEQEIVKLRLNKTHGT